ncbi:hypothetical protein ACIBCM_24185 [Streptomyces sp. NPDC051018]|uniref:hypothetical protein n=1 Tax=Streptomyces sp. NPDC051018 TaxID=3365639 RepID=UPI0037AE3644
MGIRAWGLRQWLTATVVTVVAAIAIGVPTGVVPSSLYSRMTPVLWWNYPVWALSSVLTGLLAATYAGVPRTRATGGPRGARALAAGILSVFAVGCPVCNKLVVLALGMSGAMSYWAPAQPVMALASLALLAHALVRRLRTAGACPVPGPVAPAEAAPAEAAPAGTEGETGTAGARDGSPAGRRAPHGVDASSTGAGPTTTMSSH